ncbi:MAG: MFS transporter [Bacteroidota bacterium]
MQDHLKKQSPYPYFLSIAFIAVLAEFLLVPFYPQFFEQTFGITSIGHTGYYFTACRLVLLVGFPIWAKMAYKVRPIYLLIVSQSIAGILSLICYYILSIEWFWIVSLAMLLFKSGYLLIYPLLIQYGSAQKQLKTIGILSVFIHLATLLSTWLGSYLFEYSTLKTAFIFIAIADFLQMGISFVLVPKDIRLIKENKEAHTASQTKENFSVLFFISFLFFFATTLIRPYFTKFLEFSSSQLSALQEGVIFSIPSIVALVTFPFLGRILKKQDASLNLSLFFLLGIFGLALQVSGILYAIIAGRIIYGIAIFVSFAAIDLFLFQHSSPNSYTVSYSKLHVFQNLGLLMAPLLAGIVAEKFNYQVLFFYSIAFLLVSLGCIPFLTNKRSTKVLNFKSN